MTFVHPLLLGGLLLAGIPILLHLIMRQKPKRLLFPAFRFLLERVRTNQRKIRLRHLLLLLLRIMLVVLICLALARPKLFLADSLIPLAGNQPVAVALVFDTSMSMEYQLARKSRLEEAKQRAVELLDQLPDGSKAAVFDTGDPSSGEWLDNLSFLRERIAGLRLRPDSGSVSQTLGQAYRLLGQLAEQSKEDWPRFLYVFSDRLQASWDDSQAPHLIELRDRLFQQVKVPGLYIDVGVDKPEDLAIVQVKLDRQVVPANTSAKLRPLVRATGREFSGEIVCRVDGQQIGRQPVKIGPGPGQEFVFDARDLKPGLHHAEIVLEPGDNLLPYDNARFATFEVIGPRQVLIVSDRFESTSSLRLALEKLQNPFQCEVMTTEQAKDLGLNDLAKYQVVCLISVSNPLFLWERLAKYVEHGGGLAIIPGGEELEKKHYHEDDFAKQLLPGRFDKVVKAAPAVRWEEANFTSHPIMAVYKEWVKSGRIADKQPARDVRAYWAVEPVDDKSVLVKYGDGRPALLEQPLDRNKFRGKVLLFTTPLDGRGIATNQAWNNYLEDWFYFVLVDLTSSYLAGTLEDGTLNHICGQLVVVPLPTAPRFSTYVLQGPPQMGQATTVMRPDNAGELRMPPQAMQPGPYTLTGEKQWQTGFSLNVAPAECDLTRVPKEQIEKLFGADSVIPVEHGVPFKDLLSRHWSQPVELFPWLMAMLLMILAVENLLANKFYRVEQRGE